MIKKVEIMRELGNGKAFLADGRDACPHCEHYLNRLTGELCPREIVECKEIGQPSIIGKVYGECKFALRQNKEKND